MNTPRAFFLTLMLLAGLPALVLAQDDDSAVSMSLLGIYDMTSDNLLKTAQQLDEDLYTYQPVEGVRTFGQILAHVAGAQYFFCSQAADEDNPNQANFEEVADSKDAIVEALEDAFAYCQDVYGGMTDAEGAETKTFFGREMAKSGILAFNMVHNYEHYGNLVTYMRMNDIVPPSSQQQ